MTKTFWSVKYSVWGSSIPHEEWFDNKEAADEFAAHDYRDNPVAHRFSNPEKIAAAEFAVKNGCWPNKYELRREEC